MAQALLNGRAGRQVFSASAGGRAPMIEAGPTDETHFRESPSFT